MSSTNIKVSAYVSSRKQVGAKSPYYLEVMAARLSFFLAGFSIAAWAPLVPYLKSALNLSHLELSHAILFMSGGSLIGMLVIGFLIKHLSVKWALLLASLTLTLALISLASMPKEYLLNSCILVFGFTLGALEVGSNIFGAHLEKRYQLNLLSGLHGCYSLGEILALAIITVMLVSHVSIFVAILAPASALCLITLISQLKIKTTGQVVGDEKLLALPRGSVIYLALIAALMSLGYGAISSFLGNFSQERHLETAASLFFCTSAFVTIITRPISGRFFDRFGENIVLYPAIIFTAIALLLLAIAQNSFLIILAGIFQGLGFGNFQSSGQALTLKLVSKERYAQASSTFFIFFDLGNGLSPYLFGLIAVALGFESMFYLLSALTLLTAVLYYFVHGKDHPLKMPLFKRRSKKHLSL